MTAGIRRTLAALALVAGWLAAPAAVAQSPSDPLEPLNRAVFEFNEGADRYVIKPIAEGYRAVVPQFMRTGVGNFFRNLDDLFGGINSLLQGKTVAAGDDFGRVLINTSFGILGIFDVASEAGIERSAEDFGQTFGWWGIGPGPYLVLPLLGPSSVRDTAGIGVRVVTDPLLITPQGVSWGLLALFYVDSRARLLGTETLVEQAALDKYRFVRSAYLQRRQYLVYDGKPPPAEDTE